MLATEMRLQPACTALQFLEVGIEEVREIVRPLDAVACNDFVNKLVDGEFAKIHDKNASFPMDSIWNNS